MHIYKCSALSHRVTTPVMRDATPAGVVMYRRLSSGHWHKLPGSTAPVWWLALSGNKNLGTHAEEMGVSPCQT